MTDLKDMVTCVNCHGGGFVGEGEPEDTVCEYCNGVGYLTPEQAKDIKQCDYCDEIVEELQPTPYVPDMMTGAEMCERCWGVSRDDIKGTYGRDIGRFKEDE